MNSYFLLIWSSVQVLWVSVVENSTLYSHLGTQDTGGCTIINTCLPRSCWVNIQLSERRRESAKKLFPLQNYLDPPWLVQLSGLNAGLQTKGSLVWFPVRACVWVVGRVPSRGCGRGNHTLIFLFLSFSLLFPLSKNK